MKVNRLFFATLLMTGVLFFASCEKDPVGPEPDPTEQEDPENPPVTPGDERFAGTSWMASAQGSYSYYGVNVNIDIVCALDFNMDTTGEMFMEITTAIPSMPNYPDQVSSYTSLFSYSFDGNQGMAVVREEYQGEEYITEYPLQYDEENNTLTFDMDDEEMAGILGTDVLVMTRVHK